MPSVLISSPNRGTGLSLPVFCFLDNILFSLAGVKQKLLLSVFVTLVGITFVCTRGRGGFQKNSWLTEKKCQNKLHLIEKAVVHPSKDNKAKAGQDQTLTTTLPCRTTTRALFS